MRSRPLFWIGMCLLVLAGAWVFWPAGSRLSAPKKNQPPHKIAATSGVATMRSGSTAPLIFAAGKAATNGAVAVARTNLFPYRLSNTSKSIGQLVNDPHAILLENAFIDTSAKLNLAIPKQLQAQGDPGAYIVQARGPVDAAFRADLAAAGAQIVSYIPNNAYLVRMSAAGAAAMSGNAGTAAVLPYEPAYKFSASLLGLATEQKSLPENEALTLGLFADSAPQTIAAIKKMGGTVVATDRSPFGPVVRVIPPANWTALAVLSGVQIVEPSRQRASANDLARVALEISTDTVTNANYMGLSGKNVMVEVNDTGIDAGHPDFSATGTAETGMAGPTRVIGNSADSLVDTNGHGTHVAGIIAGNGSESYTITNIPPGSVTNADFRGKAPLATLYSVVALNDDATLDISDYDLQSIPALTNALISNNSWVYSGDNAYDLAAASYDAAVRDALPYVTGSQPVMFVFAAGNDGGGDENGSGGEPDTILSPGTAKDVITVGALEQMRNITNTYTPLNTTNPVAPWTKETDSSFQVADYSARGNVGIGSEGTYGRFKPDVVAPGSFVVSTRSEQWDTRAYYNPSNYYYNEFDEQVVDPNGVQYYNLPVPGNAVSVKITLTSDGTTPFPTNLLIYVRQADYPDPTTYDFVTSNNMVMIPPDGGGGYLTTILTNGFNYAIVNPTNFSVGYNLYTEIITTNDDGDYYEVLSNLNETLAPWYRYESGTSMAAPAVSGTLALIQDYFTNTLHAAPSPALLKAMLINGARTVGNYDFVVTNGINFQGWGQPEIPDSVPPGLTNQLSAYCSTFFLDQSPANALATGDSQSWVVTVDTNSGAQTLPLRVTLAWTDPPGNPAAAIKLVNNLDLMVSNNVTGDVYFGNDFPYNATFSEAWDTNGLPNLDAINNIENVFLPAANNGSYTVTVLGRSVNVNAVTAQTNNVVQDFALVISSGNGEVTNGISIAASAAPNVALRPPVTFVATTNTLLMNQLAGGNTPLLGTNLVGAGVGYAPDAAITLGITNQWHFYVVTNTLGYTNAAFITFLSQTLATPRLGVFAEEEQNATQPEADIDLYVATEPALTNLDPNVISNCVAGLNGDGASLANGTGTEFVAYTNSVPNQIYYIGIKSETQEAAEYDFLPVFSQTPFSQSNSNGVTVNGLLLPVSIPDGTPAHPGVAYVFGLAIQPVEIQNVVVTNTFYHQNFADLVGVLTHNSKNVVLNNHNGVPLPGDISFIYDDGPTPVVGSQTSDGPGSLLNFQGQQGIGPWILTEVDNSLTQTGAVTGLTLFLKKHNDLGNGGIDVSIDAMGYFYGYIDVPPGATNLSISATNISGTTPSYTPPDPNNPGLLFEKLGEQPAPPPAVPLNYDKMVTLTNAGPLGPGGTINIGPSDVPRIQPGRYYVTLYNSSTSPQFYHIEASLELGQVATVDFGAGGPTNLLDDAAMYSSIFVTNTLPIAEMYVGLRVDHPRISDLVFHLISPDGTRYLLMENRGGTSTNGAGVTLVSTNDFPPVSYSGGPDPVTNVVPVGQNFDTVAIDYDFFDLPDEMTVYYQGGQVFDSGLISGAGTFHVSYGPGTSTNLTIIMNEFTNPAATTEWNYTIHSIQTNYLYLTFTDDTNLTTTPIKFAVPPFAPVADITQAWNNSFEGGSGTTTLHAPAFFAGGWLLNSGNIDWLQTTFNGSTAYDGDYYIDLNGDSDPGDISTNIPTMAGSQYIVSFAYARNPFTEGSPSAALKLDGNPALTITVTNINSWADLQWATTSVVFTAASALTPLEFDGLNLGSSGVLLDDVNVQLLNVSTNELYYQPEQSLDPLIGTSAFGLWQLEILDDRVGATNHTVLDDWQLQFVFANTNPVPANIGSGVTNFIPPGGLAWYEVDVPTNADYATNILTFATGPLDFWFSTNMPPTITDPAGDVLLVSGSVSNSVTLGTNGSPVNINPPAYIVPGAIYYLGIHNTNNFTVQYGVEVDFHLLNQLSGPVPFAFTEPATSLTGTNAQLNGMATPNGQPATAWFEWGQSTAYGLTTPPVNVGSGSNVVFVTSIISNLMVNLPYHYRLVVSSAYGVTYGFDHVFNQGILLAWGADFQGQTTPVPPGLTNLVVGVGAGNDFSLALNNDGTVVAWGNDSQGQTNVPVALSNAVAVAGGYSHSLALRSDRTVTVWGDDTYGQTNVPPGLTNAVEAASGNYHCLALSADGMVTAWGRDNQGQTNVVAGLSNVVAVAGGDLDSLALKNDGTVVAWGDNADGETNVPPDLTNVVAIAAGYKHNLALKSDGTVTAWGFNGNGQTNVPASLTNVIAIAAGGYHCLALLNDGTVRFWGDSSSGQTNFYPANLTNAFTIAAGGFHNLAVNGKFALNVTNTPPYWTNGLNGTTVTVDELATLTVNNTAADSNAPPQLLFYSLLNPPPYASIDSFNGIITLAPQAADGPATNLITTVATDNGYPPLSATNQFTVIVVATNQTPPQTNTIPISGIVYTNIGGTNGFLLTWFAPSNALFQVQWSDNLPFTWQTFTNPPFVSYNPNAFTDPTNTQFNYFDDGSQAPFTGSRYYELILLGSPAGNTPPVLPAQMDQTINPLNPLIVTNTAMDSDTPAQILTYSLTSTVTGTNVPVISAAGVITWTPDVSQAGTSNVITTIVADNGTPSMSATNSFAVIVNPVPDIGSVIYTNGGFLLTWWAPTNDIFQVQFTDNLSPMNWQSFSNLVTYTGPMTPTNGLFSFYDDGSEYPFTGLRFYQINLVRVTAPSLPPATNTVPISSIISTNGSFLLTWSATTNDQFNVRWTTNISSPIIWSTFPDTVISTNGTFTFVDTNAPMLMKFYELILLP